MGHASTFQDLVDELALDANKKKRDFSLRRFFRERNLSENFTVDGSSLSFGAKS